MESKKYTYIILNAESGEYLGEIESDTPIFPKMISLESMDDGEMKYYRETD